MPGKGQTQNNNGRYVATAIALLCLLGAMGTCSRFSSQNLYSGNVELTGPRTACARFDSKASESIQPEMLVVMSFKDSKARAEGRVHAVTPGTDSTRVDAIFSDTLPTLPPDRLSVDVSGIPKTPASQSLPDPSNQP
jgi:hypothetical protein